ncbi:MAG: DUF1841 family protein [Serpentinimonas sp.]|jgi:hypothetical protein|nr:DUF1841 family protein [Serpentinimonas sp.]
MFQPSPADVRRFFCQSYAKGSQGLPMEAIEQLAYGWIEQHPEYHTTLADEAAALAQLQESPPKPGVAPPENPFLHLSMHLSISEQCSIDQPPGIRQAVELLTARRDSLHQAHHEVMECLGRMLWESQQSGRPPDGHAYIDAVRRRATAD